MYNNNMSNITVEEFKTYFGRDFPYLPIYNNQRTYWLDDEVFDEDSEQFYISLKDDNTALLSDDTAWKVIKDDIFNYVLDEDIERAIVEMDALFPYHLQLEDGLVVILQCLLTAHILVNNIRTSNSGLASQFTSIVTGKSVGSVSQQYGIPQSLLSNEWGAFFIGTQYGLQYLAYLYPYLIGNASAVEGATLP